MESSHLSCLCVNLLLIAAVLQNTHGDRRLNCSSKVDHGVKTIENDTVHVLPHQTLTLNCSIMYNVKHTCAGIQYEWNNRQGKITCNSGLKEYICDWDKQTYVNLIISNVTKEDVYNCSVRTDCGIYTSDDIKVKLTSSNTGFNVKENSPAFPNHVTTALAGISASIIVVGFLYFLFGTDRGRRIIRYHQIRHS